MQPFDGGFEPSLFHGAALARCRHLWPGRGYPETVFLDRDGTIMEDRGYLNDPDGVALLPGAAKGLRELTRLGMRLVIVTNQSGVARGLLSMAQIEAVHARLVTLLWDQGVSLAGIFTCPHAPEPAGNDPGAPAPCDCRKPRTGLVREAAARLGIDPRESIVVGDKESDLALARTLGVPGVLVATGAGRRTHATSTTAADFLVEDLSALARIFAHARAPEPIHGAEPNGAPA